ncbi:hypothetical protein CDAR_611901 [Caerostris darwini]|uniref:Uncharacterized protein n=1 Tax=Caerostris darwini TaxID=1538125 RepID=A0AAV4MSE0_9ARAC|nr:hypothetical protein CDAR_611901 [Caerostris darwini]
MGGRRCMGRYHTKTLSDNFFKTPLNLDDGDIRRNGEINDSNNAKNRILKSGTMVEAINIAKVPGSADGRPGSLHSGQRHKPL